ncbi:MAG TPA: hypothetical protein VGP24_12150 [Glaciihabitans sp.]|nr:hypothetical protein [Glaciihabitans sp.]
MSSRFSRATAITAAGLLALSLSACTSGSFLGASPLDAATPTTVAQPVATTTPLVFDSVFTDMGSVHPAVMVSNQLELELDMWTEQKTHEWYTDSEKTFSFVINVYDLAVPAEASFATKRQVFMSNLSVKASTTTTSGAVETPLILDVDPVAVTLDPEALKSENGLLITSPKGGFQLEGNTIGVLAPDTLGLTLDFAMTISTESTSGSGVYMTQVVHQVVPVAIFSR